MGKLVILMKVFELGLHLFDIYSDVALTILYYQNCNLYYAINSLLIMVLSYISTLIALRFGVHNNETLYQAVIYPYKTMRIVSKKAFVNLLSKY